MKPYRLQKNELTRLAVRRHLHLTTLRRWVFATLL